MALEDTFKLGLLMKLIDEFSKPSTQLVDRMETMRKSAERLKKTSETMTKVGAAVSLAGGALLGSLVIPTKIAADFRESMADLQTATQFSPEEYNKFSAAIVNMSKRIPLGTKELISLARTGKQLGMSNADLLQFTENAAKLSIVLRTTPEAAGAAMADLADIYSLPMEKVGLLGDSILHVASKMEVGSADILSFLTNVGNSATNIGLTAQQTAALGSALLRAGQTPEKATMAFNDMFNTFNTLGEQPKEVRKAFAEMGIPPNTFAAVLKKYPIQAMVSFLEHAKKTGNESELFFRIFGERSAARLVKLTNNLDIVKAALGEVSDETSYAGETNKRFEERTKELNEQIKLFWNRLKAVGKMIGDFVLPKVIALATRVASVTGRIGDFMEKHQKLARIITIVVGGMGLFLLVAGGLLTFFGTIGFMIANVILAATGLGITMAAVGTFITGVLIPIGLVILAIAGIAVAAFLIYKYWEPIKAFFSDLWGKIREEMQRTWEAMKTGAQQAWTNLTTPFTDAYNKISESLRSINLYQAGVDFIQSLIDGIKQKVWEIPNLIGDALKQGRAMFGFSAPTVGPFRDINRIRLMEEVAKTLRPDPLLTRMESILSAVKEMLKLPLALSLQAGLGGSPFAGAGLTPAFAGMPSPSLGPTAATMPGPGGVPMGRSIVINIAPGAINITGANIKDTRDLARRIGEESGQEIDKQLRRKFKI